MGKIKSPEDLEKLYATLKYRVLNKKAQAVTPEEIEAMARPHYADSGSHGWNHIQDVLASARRMRRKELLKKELAALMYHDSSLLTGPRETHAEDSADIAKKELAGKFSRRQLEDIVNAIAHHRASYEGKRKSKLENLVAAADRDVFVDGNIDDYILRSYKYGLEHGMTPDEAVDNTLHHMPDKYGTNGYAYANVPKIYMDTYGDDVRKAQKAFDSITADMIREISKSASDAKYSLKDDPTYEDALKVFNKLDFDDRANIAPRHPDFLRKVPDDILFDRQVAIDGDGNPVGFNEFYYGRNKLGRRQPPHNAIAVVHEARGNGLSNLMVDAAIRKARKEKIKRLVWEAFADNEPSIRAALSAGFDDATPKNAKGYRRFVYRVSEKKASSKKETYESGDGKVESYTPDKTDGHDEIVLRLKNGKKIVVSNNTKLGIRVIPADGDRVGYNGYRINGTNVVHKVHGNKHQRGGWLEYSENTP